jgi:hypothetical protein
MCAMPISSAIKFADFYCDPVPKHDAFNRGFNRLTPQTLKAVNDLLVQAAVKLGLEDGAKLRVDTTVVETDIHHPTDNTLLWDVVRVLTRLLGRLAKALEVRRIEGFRDRRRAAHRRMYEIQRMTTRQRQAPSAAAGSRQTAKYRELIGIAEAVVASATAAVETTAMRGTDLLAAMRIAALRDEIAHYGQAGDRAAALLGAEDRGLFLGLADEHHALRPVEFAQVLRHHGVLALALAELHEWNLMPRHEAFQSGHEVAAHRAHQRRRWQRLAAVLAEEPHNPPLALQTRHIDVEVHPVDAFDRKLDMSTENIGHALCYHRSGSGRRLPPLARVDRGGPELGYTKARHEPAIGATLSTGLQLRE